MELNKNNREALIERLKQTIEAIDSKKRCIESSQKDEKGNKDLICWWDMDVFLLEKQKELIEQSLIDNEIDF